MKMPRNKNGLTAYQQCFVDEYFVDLNQTKAILRAGFAGKETSAKTAATRMMRNVHVKALVQQRLEDRSVRTQITADQVLIELANIGFYDLKKIFDEKNNLKNIHDLDDQTSRAISSVEIEVNDAGARVISTTKKIKMGDKIRALQLIGNHIGMFKEASTGAEDIAKALKQLAQGLPD